jgi:hypothetical protein
MLQDHWWSLQLVSAAHCVRTLEAAATPAGFLLLPCTLLLLLLLQAYADTLISLPTPS